MFENIKYDQFVRDVAKAVAEELRSLNKGPEYISQRKAYTMFGRGNVDRWRRQGKISPSKRPGKVEYITAELRALQQVVQDYF